MDIRKKFLKLTKKTYPYGTEAQLTSHLPQGYFKDSHGNYYYKIGNSRTSFTCHLDTACKDQVDVVHKFENNIISTNGKSILGADDKAGMTIILYMIEKRIPGLYCFFIGEEVGCIGSGNASEDSVFKSYDRMISFDRRGTNSVITHQSSKRCCSEDFAIELSNRLNKYGLKMEPDNTGVYTDSAEFVSVIPECTNISVGYYKEHTCLENQDIDHLFKLCIAVTRIEWENLPTKRDPSKVEYKPYAYKNYEYSSYDKEYEKYEKSWNGWDKSPSKTRRGGAKKSKNGYYDDYYFEDDDYCTPNRFETGKNGRVYFETLDNDISDKTFFTDGKTYESTQKFHYEPLKQELFKDTFTTQDIQKIKKSVY